MNWKRLFESHILERGYSYYYKNTVEVLDIKDGIIRADVWGSRLYKVEISLSDGAVKDMYCSCPYAADGRNCKHMAAVLYEWSENDIEENEVMEIEENAELFKSAFTINAQKKKQDAVEKLVADAGDDDVRSFLVSVLTGDEKLLLRFYNIVNERAAEVDIKNYIRQIDIIVENYLGKYDFIDYYEADGFIAELEEFIDVEVCRLIDNGNYLSAFEVMNYIFVMIGDVDMDDSDGGTGILAHKIYQLWLELLDKVNLEDKKKMFEWFTAHLDGSVIEYFEEYIEQMIMEQFKEKEFEQAKLDFLEDMIKKSEQNDSGWTRDYEIGKWAIKYLEALERKKVSEKQIEEVCKKYWSNSSVRRYYIDFCKKRKKYDRALQVLDESILLDKNYRGLISEHNRKKKEIYRLQGNKSAYIEQLWKLLLEYDEGDLGVYKELKKQYTAEEWLVKREEILKKLSENANVEEIYKEEKMYDRLLEYVLNSSGLDALKTYESVLKKEYPEQILDKYRGEVNKMALHTSDRNHYSYLVSLLRRMKKIKGGTKIVEKIVEEWKVNYKNRRAMMDELRKL